MNKSILFVASRPISVNDKVSGFVELFKSKGWDVSLWSYYEVPEFIVQQNIVIYGPEHKSGRRTDSWILSLRPMRSSRKIFRIPRQLFVVKVLAVKNKALRYIRNKWIRELNWLSLKLRSGLTKKSFHVVAAVDPFSLFATWKLVQRSKPAHARSNLTNLDSLLDAEQ